MNTFIKNIVAFLLFAFLVNICSFAQTTNQQKDTTRLKYNFKHFQNGGLFLKDPAKMTIIFDKELNKYVLVEKIGNYYVRTPIFMTKKEYKKYRLQRDMLDYFKTKVSATNSRKKGVAEAQKNLLPTYYVNSKFFETIFGGNTIDVIPTGSLNVKMGFIYQKTENPQLSEENRSSFTFDFDQQINASIQAKIGKRLKITANYDTQSTFDFQQIIKLEYTPTEDDILQGIDAGNINMPIKNSLINGAQSLFGVKAKLKFGNTNITAVFSQQNSESKTVTAQAGATIQPFELHATDYDNDRHFFLSQYFRNNYANSLKEYPLISSPINITRIEVWVTNKIATTDDFRSIVAFADIGESIPKNLVSTNGSIVATNPPSIMVNGVQLNLPSNKANNIYQDLLTTHVGGIRDIGSVNATLGTSTVYQMQQGTHYTLLQNARKLKQNEFTLNPQLGFISLNRRLNDGEVLAVAYEYTVAGTINGSTEKSFKVGEFSNDGIQAPDNLAVKLLRSEILTTKRTVAGVEEAFPTWKLMMKNVYALGATPLTQEGFRFEIQYRDDQTGIPSNTLQNAQTTTISNKPLLEILRLDQLDQSKFKNSDGFFDYIEGITVNSKYGYVIFPTPEPFGKNLEVEFTSQTDKDNYVFNELYIDTKNTVKNNYQHKDKFLLKGYFKTTDAGGIPIGAFNVPRGSVKVTAGGRQLVEGVDFVVDYLVGRVQILDLGLKASGVPIQVSTENNSVFNQQRKTFIGVEVEHKFSENFIIGGTYLNITERPLTQKVNFGAEPIDNTMLGFNVDFSTEVPLFTKWANLLPFVDTDAPSNLSVRADMAYLIPGTPNGIDISGTATSYIDDFEASQVPISLLSPLQWYPASTPQKPSNDFFGNNDDITYNFRKSRLAWYNIDQIFYGAGDVPSNIDADQLSRAETRQISFTELFPNTELDFSQNSLVRTLDLAYFPHERGAYNFDTGNNVKADGTFNNPKERWGGIMYPLTTNDFNNANIEYIQFWMMDPYDNYSITNAEGLPTNVNPQNPTFQVGDLYINLGNVSEDILKDNHKMYENGLPADGVKIVGTNVKEPIDANGNNRFGYVPFNPSILYTFDADDTSRKNQDIGLDGLNNIEERDKFKNHPLITNFNLLNTEDPASDDFKYFRGGYLDNKNASIITRYKYFNNTQGNSPTVNQSTESYPTSSTTYPDVEDINKDQTMNTVESYFEYKISMNKTDLVKGQNFIVDEKTTTVTLKNGSTQQTKWYQFRVPIRSGTAINGITDFNSIRFMRMYLTHFKMPVVLRFGELDLVRGDWRRYVKTLDPAITPNADLTQTELNDFEVGVINIEQNEGRYVLPPGIVRERLQGSTTVQLQNEQSVTLKVKDLPQNKVRAIYKNISVDLRRYKKLKMFMHLEPVLVGGVTDDEMMAIVRLGTDLNDNFYQIEIPLKVSTKENISSLDVWPEANNLEGLLENFGKIKLKRDKEIIGGSPIVINQLYPVPTTNDPKEIIVRVKGNPTLAKIRTIMLGIKNTAPTNRSAEIWFNELRSSDFDNDGGWAAVVNADANFADIANVSISGKIQTLGFGSVEDRITQRSLDQTKQYNLSTNVQLGKVLTPKKWGIQLPMSYSIGEEFINPKYDPQYQDVKLTEAKDVNPNSKYSNSYTKRTSISFINVRKNRNPQSKRKPHFYDVENLSISYAHNKEFHRDYNIEKFINQTVNASATYNYTFRPIFVEPFKKIKGKYWQIIRDLNLNLIPKTVAVNSRINRNYVEQQSRNLVPGLSAQPKLKQRRFLFDWDYSIGLDLTKSISLNFNATNSYVYDPFGSGEDLQIFDNFFAVGKQKKYHQTLNATYKLPIGKIPFLNFIKADYGYTADFDWQASSQDVAISDKIGNIIQNSNNKNININLNLAKFYKKIGFEKLMLSKRSRKKRKRETSLKNPLGPSRVRKNKLTLGKKIIKGVYDIITSIKTGKLSYTETNGQLLPGYKKGFGFFGGTPTAFAFGSQVDIRNKAIENRWIVTRDNGTEYFNKTYSRTHKEKLEYNFSVKPFKDFNIDVRGNRIQTRDLTQQLDVITGKTTQEKLPVSENGNFSTSYSMLSTVFTKGDQLFKTFKEYRNKVSTRLGKVGYGTNSQQVMLPAFLAAYSGKNPNKVSTSLFRNIPIPNWTVRYNGLMKLKWFKKRFNSFTVSHGYKSSYTLASFTNNLQYSKGAINPITSNYEPELLISTATLIDEFSPLIKIDMKMKNSFSLRGEIRKDRTLTLNFNNSTLTDIRGIEFIFGLGYVIKDVKFITKFTGSKKTFKGDINFRVDMSLRDNLTLIRNIENTNSQISGGQRLFSIKFTADYRLSRSLTTSFYYNHQTSKYAISTTFPRQAINAGFNLIYNLGN